MQISRKFSFQAAHQIVINKQKETVHGHSWYFKVTLQGNLNDEGIVFDFEKLGSIVNLKIIDVLDHGFLNDIISQPTTENVAIWIWNKLKELPLYSIRVWENKDCEAAYYGE